MNIVSLFESSARKFPDKAFLCYAGQEYTYAETSQLSRRAATVFAQRGVKAGDRVALMCFNTPAFVIAMLGAWRLGAVVVPVNHKLQAPEVDYVLQHAGAKLLIADSTLAGVVGRVTLAIPTMSTGTPLHGTTSFDAALADAGTYQGGSLSDDDVAEILYTSGTTGRPKGCVMTHRSVCLAGMNVAVALSMHRDERTLIAMPLWHSSPLNNWMIGTLYVGGTIILQREYDPTGFLRTVQEERVTLYFGAPVSYTLPLNLGCEIERFDLSSVRAWIYGGGPIGAETARRLAQAYRSDCFYQVFGMTETGPAGMVLYPAEQIAKAGSIGKVAAPGVDVRVVDADGNDIGPNQIGEIWLRADSTMNGYLDDPEATARAFNDSWYCSGDLARMDEDGYLFIVDRSKDMIVTGGENVYSKEVEDVMLAHPAIADVAVIGRPHPEWGETVIAVWVPRGDVSPDPESLREFLAPRLAKYKIPREFIVRQTLPRTPSGKLMKHLLRAELI